jgi:hypothetical protein
MAELWSDYTDSIISDIDNDLSGKYKMTLRDFLTNPTKYAAQQNIKVTIANMKEDVNRYIDEVVAGLGSESKTLQNDMSRVDSITKQLSQNISMQAKQYGVPLINPVDVSRNEDEDTVITIDSVEADTIKLVDSLTKGSTFICDFSYEYKEYNIGSWLFCGGKNYSLGVFVPPNEIFNLDGARSEITSLLDQANSFIISRSNTG